MDATYKDFIEGGQIIYPGKADFLRVYSGRERLILAWPASTDPKVEYAKIYWNNRTDSVEVPLEGMVAGQDTVVVPFNNLAEGSYVFEIFTFDTDGNRSVKVETLAQVYGDSYESKLLSRPIEEAQLDDNILNITWGAAPDASAIGSEITYTDINGVEQTLFIPGTEPITEIPEFAFGTMEHRTLYLPNEWAIDTFYTDYTSRYIEEPVPLLPPVQLPKTGWTITASSEDVAGGRTAANLIDGNVNTMWVNQLGAGLTNPHTITVDMGEVVDDIAGFYFYQRSLNPTRNLEVQTSMDGETWETYGQFTLPSTSGEPVYLELPNPVSFRYFQHIYLDNYGGSDNVNIMEMGVYNRQPPPPVHLDKTGWIITASSEDVAGGRTAANLIDGDVNTMWVNQLGAGLTNPHTITVDMGEVVDDIAGFYFYQRSLNPTRNLEVQTSMDGETWETYGQFTLPSTSGEPVYLELPNPVSFRYFQHIYLDNYGGSDNVNIMEMGVFTHP
jgi:hypothetical protein